MILREIFEQQAPGHWDFLEGDVKPTSPVVDAVEMVPLLRKAKQSKADHDYFFNVWLPAFREKHGAEYSTQAYRSALKMIGESQGVNPKDIAKIDIPLLIRLLEYAREDAKTDMDLHNVTERIIALSQGGKTLGMQDYDKICKTQKENN